MALIYPIEKDIRFKQGLKAGEDKVIKKLLLSSLNLSHQKIADCLEVSL